MNLNIFIHTFFRKLNIFIPKNFFYEFLFCWVFLKDFFFKVLLRLYLIFFTFDLNFFVRAFILNKVKYKFKNLYFFNIFYKYFFNYN